MNLISAINEIKDRSVEKSVIMFGGGSPPSVWSFFSGLIVLGRCLILAYHSIVWKAPMSESFMRTEGNCNWGGGVRKRRRRRRRKRRRRGRRWRRRRSERGMKGMCCGPPLGTGSSDSCQRSILASFVAAFPSLMKHSCMPDSSLGQICHYVW